MPYHDQPFIRTFSFLLVKQFEKSIKLNQWSIKFPAILYFHRFLRINPLLSAAITETANSHFAQVHRKQQTEQTNHISSSVDRSLLVSKKATVHISAWWAWDTKVLWPGGSCTIPPPGSPSNFRHVLLHCRGSRSMAGPMFERLRPAVYKS
ncbi:unnamed protein product [Ixodes pacificus]